MNGMVDSRVVEMHFDNSDFMDKIGETIAALERLNDQISSINKSNGLDNLARSMGGNNLSNVETAVGGIANRFSTLGIVGMTVIQRLTNAGIDMALKIGNGIKAIGNQIKYGGFERAKNIEQAKFLLEGLGADVEKVMEDVNYAVDGTSYGLDEAARASASFFASGIKAGDQMKNSLRAVSGVAAMTGADYASIADIFTTVAGQGRVMTMQLRQLEGRGLNAAATLRDFFNGVNDGSIKATDSMKKAVKQLTGGSKVSEEAVRNFVSQGKVDFDMFSTAMDNAFGEHATEANKTFSGSLANMKTALSRLGEAFISPAMQAAIPLFNSIREAISSYTTTLKDLGGIDSYFTPSVTALGESMSTLISRMTQIGIFEDLAKSAINGFRVLTAAGQAVKDAFKDVFPNVTVKNLKEITSGIRKTTREFADSHNKLEGLKNVLTGIFSGFKIAWNIFSGLAKVLYSVVKAIFGIGDSVGGLSGKFRDLMKALDQKTGTIGIFDKLASVINGAGGLINKALSVILGGIKHFISGVGDIIGGIDNVNDALALTGLAFTAIFAEKKFWWIKDWQKRIRALLGFENDSSGLAGLIKLFDPSKLNDIFSQLTNALKGLQREIYAKALQKIALAVLALAIALKILSDINILSLSKALAALTVIFGELVIAMGLLVGMFSGGFFAESLKTFYAIGVLGNALLKIAASMVLMAYAVKMISSVEPKKLASGLIGITVILGAVLGFVMALDKYGYAMEAKLSSISLAMIAMGASLILMSKAVERLSSIDTLGLAKGLGSIIVLMGAIFGLMVGVSSFVFGGGAQMAAMGAGMILMATAINILAPALERLGGIPLANLAKGLGAVILALAAMGAVSLITNISGSAGIFVLSLALASLATSLQRLGEMDIKTLATSLGALAVGLGLILAAGAVVSVFPAIASGLGILALAMLGISGAIALFGAGLMMIGAGLTSISAGIMSFAAVSQTAVLMFANTIQTLIGAIIQLLPSIALKMAEAFTTFLQGIATLSPEIATAMTTIIATMIEALNNNVPALIDCGLNLITSFLSSLRSNISQIVGTATQIVARFIQGVADNIGAVINAGINLMVSFINGLAQGIRNNKEAISAAMLNLCVALLEAFAAFFGIHSPSTVMEEQGIYLGQGLINGIMKMPGEVAKAFISMVRSGFKAVSKWGSSFKASGVTLVKRLASGISSKGSTISSNVKSAIKRAYSSVTGYISKFASAGLSLARGIARGIRNGASSVISAGGSIARAALNKFKSALGIHSPSKVFTAAASWIPEGIVVGLKKTAGKVYSAINNIANTSVDIMGSVISRAYEKLNTTEDFNPTITPVLDLSEVKKEAGGINSILGDNSISMAYSAKNANDVYQEHATNRMIEVLVDKIGSLTESNNTNNLPPMTNYFNIDGARDPEDYADRLIRRFAMEMRTT